MYTDAMRRAFHAVRPPKNFAVELLDNDTFLTIRADEKKFAGLLDEEKREAVEYIIRLKKALEENGAVVLVVRKAIQ
jgi:hypothetical protein